MFLCPNFTNTPSCLTWPIYYKSIYTSFYLIVLFFRIIFSTWPNTRSAGKKLCPVTRKYNCVSFNDTSVALCINNNVWRIIMFLFWAPHLSQNKLSVVLFRKSMFCKWVNKADETSLLPLSWGIKYWIFGCQIYDSKYIKMFCLK